MAMKSTMVPDVNILVIKPSGPETWYTLSTNNREDLLKPINPFRSIDARINRSLPTTEGISFR